MKENLNTISHCRLYNC